jgi:polysaccharide export outer membrane protein
MSDQRSSCAPHLAVAAMPALAVALLATAFAQAAGPGAKAFSTSSHATKTRVVRLDCKPAGCMVRAAQGCSREDSRSVVIRDGRRGVVPAAAQVPEFRVARTTSRQAPLALSSSQTRAAQKPGRPQPIQLVSFYELPEPTAAETSPLPAPPPPETLALSIGAQAMTPPAVDDGLVRNPLPLALPAMNSIPWEVFAQGEYIGPPRTPHLPEYRVRVDDLLLFVFRITREPSAGPYLLKVGDSLKVESLTSEKLNHSVIVEPDGMISLPLAGRIDAAGKSLDEVRAAIEANASDKIRDPEVSVIPEQLDLRLEELRATVDNRSAAGGQSFEATVAPDGSIQVPAIGSLSVVGLSLPELNSEISRRYSSLFPGIEVTAVLRQRAARYVYVLGEVRNAGRYTLVAPTTALQAISLAGGQLVGSDLTNIIVLRRDENWRLIACRIDLSEDLRGDCINHTHDIWLRDSDILLLPKSHCQRMDEYIDLVLTRGLYGIVPIRYAVSYTRISN